MLLTKQLVRKTSLATWRNGLHRTSSLPGFDVCYRVLDAKS